MQNSRALIALPLIALALGLSACSQGASPSATPTVSDAPQATASAEATPTASDTPTPTPTPIPPSNNLDAITVKGEPGQAPEVTVASPWAIDETRTKKSGKGKGPGAPANAVVEVQYTGVNGRTGQKFDSSWDRGKPALFSLEQVVPGFTKGLTGAKAGERIVIGMPGSDGYDSSGGSPQAGIEVGDSLVFVVDVIAVQEETATGQATKDATPVQVGDDGGKPTVTIPSGATPPTANQSVTLIQGEQRPVADTDTVMVRYRAYSWKTGQLIEDKFDQPQAGALGDLLGAWKEGLVGKPIGSRVLVVAANPYPNGNQNPTIEAGDTVVYVVDVLFATSAT